MVNSYGYDGSHLQEDFEGISDKWKSILKWFGFYTTDDPIWLQLAPYVILFSLSVLLHRNFKQKMQFENMRLL